MHSMLCYSQCGREEEEAHSLDCKAGIGNEISGFHFNPYASSCSFLPLLLLVFVLYYYLRASSSKPDQRKPQKPLKKGMKSSSSDYSFITRDDGTCNELNSGSTHFLTHESVSNYHSHAAFLPVTLLFFVPMIDLGHQKQSVCIAI